MNTKNSNLSTKKSRNFFCTLNNPQVYLDLSNSTPKEIVNAAGNQWLSSHPGRSCIISYELGAQKTPHLHMFLHCDSNTRCSSVYKVFPAAHIELPKNINKCLSYLFKKSDNKSFQIVVFPQQFGNLPQYLTKTFQDYSLRSLFDQGLTPNEIVTQFPSYKCMLSSIYTAYNFYQREHCESDSNVYVEWHYGESGTGKTPCVKQIVNSQNESYCFITAVSKNCLESYSNESILVLDNYDNQLDFSLLLALLSTQNIEIPARFHNIFLKVKKIYITSIASPGEIYEKYKLAQHATCFTKEQLLNRIDKLVYHSKENNILIETDIDIPRP